jgi:hypothetical protein
MQNWGDPRTSPARRSGEGGPRKQSPRWRTPKQGPYSGRYFFDFFAFFGILVVFARPATGVM